MRIQRIERSGTTLVESAIVYPLVLIFLIGTMIGAMGIFRYQEMASLARRAARYAVVHGAKSPNDKAAPTPAEIFDAVVFPNGVSLDRSKITYSITYNTDNTPYHTAIVNDRVVAITNTVTVTINYRWLPEAFLGGMTLSSTSSMPMAY